MGEVGGEISLRVVCGGEGLLCGRIVGADGESKIAFARNHVHDLLRPICGNQAGATRTRGEPWQTKQRAVTLPVGLAVSLVAIV